MYFTLMVDWPDQSLFVNRFKGRHWSLGSEERKTAREWAFLEARGHGAQLGDPNIDHAVSINIRPPDNRWRDVDGLLTALKPTLDGLAQGLGMNDYHFNPIEIKRLPPVQGGSISIVVYDDLPF